DVCSSDLGERRPVLGDDCGNLPPELVYAAIAHAAGFPRARTIEALDELGRQIPAIVAEDGPALTVLRVEPETGFLRTPPMTYEGPEMKYRFGHALERRFGIEVFGPQGY